MLSYLPIPISLHSTHRGCYTHVAIAWVQCYFDYSRYSYKMIGLTPLGLTIPGLYILLDARRLVEHWPPLIQ